MREIRHYLIIIHSAVTTEVVLASFSKNIELKNGLILCTYRVQYSSQQNKTKNLLLACGIWFSLSVCIS